jgi:alpha-tubulin suppressor-like RCC1 family protein
MLTFPDPSEGGRGGNDIESFEENDGGEGGANVGSSSSSSTIPASIGTRQRALSVCCGTRHTLIMTEGGYVYGVGIGYFGQLGCGDDASSHTPRLIKVSIYICSGRDRERDEGM